MIRTMRIPLLLVLLVHLLSSSTNSNERFIFAAATPEGNTKEEILPFPLDQKLVCETCQSWMLEIRKALEEVYCHGKLSYLHTAFPPLIPPTPRGRQGKFNLMNLTNVELSPQDVAVQLLLSSPLMAPLHLLRRGALKFLETFLGSSSSSPSVLLHALEEMEIEAAASGADSGSSRAKEMDEELFSMNGQKKKKKSAKEEEQPFQEEFKETGTNYAASALRASFFRSIGIHENEDEGADGGPLAAFAGSALEAVLERYNWDEANRVMLVEPQWKTRGSAPNSEEEDFSQGDLLRVRSLLEANPAIGKVFSQLDLMGVVADLKKLRESDPGKAISAAANLEKATTAQQAKAERELINLHALAKLQAYIMFSWYKVKYHRESPFKTPFGQTAACLRDWIVPTDVLVQEMCVGLYDTTGARRHDSSKKDGEDDDHAKKFRAFVLEMAPELVQSHHVSFQMCPALVLTEADAAEIKANTQLDEEAAGRTKKPGVLRAAEMVPQIRTHLEHWLGGESGHLAIERLFHWQMAG